MRLPAWIMACVVVHVASGLAQGQKFAEPVDGIYDFTAAPHTGTLAIKSAKGGLLFEIMTASPKGTTCEARGKATGGRTLTFREGDAGFRLHVEGVDIRISGLIGQVSDTTFCGLGARLTGVYKKRSGRLDAKTAAALAQLEKPSMAKAPTLAPTAARVAPAKSP